MNEMNEWDEWDELKEWDESLWWKLIFIIVMKVHLDYENSSLWWRLIMSAEIHHNDADNWTEWWKMILQMKIYHSDENMMGIYHWNSSKKIEILDLHINIIHFALQCLAWFGLFDTFPGWVGRAKPRLKTISAQLKLKFGLSLAKSNVIAKSVNQNESQINNRIQ